MSEKVIGYALLVLGLAIIGFSAFDVYQVFTKQKQPIQLFSFKGISIDPTQYTPQLQVPEGMESLVREKPQEPQLVEILPADMINQSSNIFAHLFLMGFIVNIGGKIATLGTTLARTIVVKVNSKNKSETSSTTV